MIVLLSLSYRQLLQATRKHCCSLLQIKKGKSTYSYVKTKQDKIEMGKSVKRYNQENYHLFGPLMNSKSKQKATKRKKEKLSASKSYSVMNPKSLHMSETLDSGDEMLQDAQIDAIVTNSSDIKEFSGSTSTADSDEHTDVVVLNKSDINDNLPTTNCSDTVVLREYGGSNESAESSESKSTEDTETPGQRSDVLGEILTFPMLLKKDKLSSLMSVLPSVPRAPSVTKILSDTMPPEKRFFLERWEKEMIEKLGIDGFKDHKQGLYLCYLICLSFQRLPLCI